jgi:hypothetical protein
VPFSISGPRRPFFRSAGSRSVRKALPCLPEVPPSGFGYPPGGVSAPRPVGASFSSRRPWASPFRAFILPGDREEGFPSSPSAPALSRQTFPAWRRSLGGLIPPRKPCPLLLPWMFIPGRGLVLSWAFRPFRLSLPKNPRRGFSPRSHPSRSFPRTALRPNGSGTPGVSGSPGPASPSEEGAGPYGLFHRRPCATL